MKAVTEGAQIDAEAAVTQFHGHFLHSTSRTQHYFTTTNHRSRRISHPKSQNLHTSMECILPIFSDGSFVASSEVNVANNFNYNLRDSRNSNTWSTLHIDPVLDEPWPVFSSPGKPVLVSSCSLYLRSCTTHKSTTTAHRPRFRRCLCSEARLVSSHTTNLFTILQSFQVHSFRVSFVHALYHKSTTVRPRRSRRQHSQAKLSRVRCIALHSDSHFHSFGCFFVRIHTTSRLLHAVRGYRPCACHSRIPFKVWAFPGSHLSHISLLYELSINPFHITR